MTDEELARLIARHIDWPDVCKPHQVDPSYDPMVDGFPVRGIPWDGNPDVFSEPTFTDKLGGAGSMTFTQRCLPAAVAVRAALTGGLTNSET